MTQQNNQSTIPQDYNLLDALADKAGVSKITLWKAWKRKPIAPKTAAKIANSLDIPLAAMRIKNDHRGRRGKGKKNK